MKIKYKTCLIVAFLFLAMSFAAAQEKVIEVSLDVYGNDEVNVTFDGITIPEYRTIEVVLTDLRLVETTFITNNTRLLRDDIRADLVSGQNILYSTFTTINFLLPESLVFVPLTQTVLFLPYSEDADLVKIYKDENEILSIGLKDSLCNRDSICGVYENHLSCSTDCPSGSKDNFCDKKDDNVCDIDCLFGDPDCYSYPKYDKFTPSLTTDFKLVNKTHLDYLRNVVFGIEKLGQIVFGESRVDVSGADLDAYVTIESGKIAIDVTMLPGLNKPAKLLFPGEHDKILKDSVECSDCQVKIVNGSTVVTVSNFNGEYSIPKPINLDLYGIFLVIIGAIIIGFLASRFIGHHRV